MPGRLTTAAVVLAVLLGSGASRVAAADPTPPPTPATSQPRLDRPQPSKLSDAVIQSELEATGFGQTAVISGLNRPTAVEFSPDGRVFVAEKPGIIKEFDSLTDPTPTVWADIRPQVHDFWDRGLLGMALDPSFLSNGRIYVAYSYNKPIGNALIPSTWPDQNCPSPPGATTDGCTILGRVSALTSTGPGTVSEQPLLTDWCQQFPSHSMSDIVFDSEGALYVNGGDGASFDAGETDYGQLGGSLPNTPTPKNPCNDPPGDAMTIPTAEGGSLRSQDLRSTGDPVGLNGAVSRIDRFTGNAMPDNPTTTGSENNQRIIAYGLRNPFRMAVRPGSDELWIGDVGFATWEEIDRHTNPDGVVRNFGWPCHEGNHAGPGQFAQLDLCINLGSAWTAPYFEYNQHAEIVPTGDGCGTGGRISGLAFYQGGPYPPLYDGALFFTDYTRQCLWAMPLGVGGVPDPAQRDKILTLANPVQLTTGPGGDLFYVDLLGGKIWRVSFLGANRPPVAALSASPTSGSVPLTVNFNASASSDPDMDPLTYAWDLDGDGAFDDGSGATQMFTYMTRGTRLVTVQVSDDHGATDTASKLINVDNEPPVATITSPAPTLKWSVGQTISFAGTGTDPDSGTLPASAFTWDVILHHCTTACHEHPLSTFSGVKSGSFAAPDHEYPSFLEIRLTVDDGDGATDTASVEIDPKPVTVRVESAPTGISVGAGTMNGLTPYQFTAIAGSSLELNAPGLVTKGGVTYVWSSWSDDGGRIHRTKPTASTTYRASYFSDAGSSIFKNDILWLAETGITRGCGPTTFCPNDPVTREQMASFLARALHLPATSTDFFTDDESSQHEGDINRIAAAGLTGGCTATRFCPTAVVTREQMASFLARALHLSASPTDFFTDDESSQHEGDINRIAAADITRGCTATTFCPRNAVSRGQMAAFLHRAFEDRFP